MCPPVPIGSWPPSNGVLLPPGARPSFLWMIPPPCPHHRRRSYCGAMMLSCDNGSAEHHVKARPFSTAEPANREVILVGAAAPPGGADAWKQLVRRAARGATIVFLSPQVFRDGEQATRWLPLQNKGTYRRLTGWLYHEDQWAKRHPVFEGLPSGGLMDYTFYREIVPNEVFAGQDPPLHAIAAANDASFDYSSGLIVAEYQLGAGRFLLNTLLIRENLGPHPVAQRLLGNLLRYAASGIHEPLAPVPVDWEQFVQELGY